MKNHYKKHIRLETGTEGSLHPPHCAVARILRKKFHHLDRPVMAAVGGPGGTGKTSFAAKLAKELGTAVILALDDYKTPRAYRAGRNIFGPHPEANEMDLVKRHLAMLRRGESIQKPVYCRQAGEIQSFERFDPEQFVIVEGEIATYHNFHDEIDFSIFIDSHWKTQLNTRIERDIGQRGYTPQKAIAAFLYSNLHEFLEYGLESKKWADIHIHCDAQYQLVIDAVCPSIADLFQETEQPFEGGEHGRALEMADSRETPGDCAVSHHNG